MLDSIYRMTPKPLLNQVYGMQELSRLHHFIMDVIT